jgi:hypothetical protein
VKVLPVTLGTEDLDEISPHPGVLPLPLLAQYGKGRTRLCWEAEAWDIFVKLIPVVRLLRQTD